MEFKNCYLLVPLVVIMVIINFLTISKTNIFLEENEKNKKIYYEDLIYIYEVCNKKWWDKTSLRNRIYEDKKTEFREFILWK